MILITSIAIQNFKCFRKKQQFNLEKSNYLIGTNNAGKSAILKAIHCFFDNTQYSQEYVNKTELRSKGKDHNKSIIWLTFDLNAISGKSLRNRLIKKYGNNLIVSTNFTVREITNTIVINYTYQGESTELLPDDIKELFSKISVSYIHPQDAKDLLPEAQRKLKTRLLSNWGRNHNICEDLKKLQTQWSDLRKKANTYLSKGLTENLQKIWPGCETKVDLPDKIDNIISISEIMFKSSFDSPEISLTSQGTGAQSTILYHTHFMLDSDKTLHRGFHYPVWLIEEPESFLHADIVFKLGSLLSSDSWINNIQMFISTHSPLLLSTCKQNEDKIKWFLVKEHELKEDKMASKWEESELRNIGKTMGDPNFDVYFYAAQNKVNVFIEDSKDITKDKFIEAGIQVTKQLEGVAEMRRYFDVLNSIDNLSGVTYFLVDNDKGYDSFKAVLEGIGATATKQGFKSYKFRDNLFVILFPTNYAVEDLFREFERVVESCAQKLFDKDYKKASSGNIPGHLTRVHAKLRGKHCNGLDEAKNLIRKEQDIKDCFWREVKEKGYKMDKDIISELASLIKS